MDRDALDAWVTGYVRAWESNDPEEIGRLFAGDADYFTAPDQDPWRGRDAIVAGWLGRLDESDDWSFRYEILAVADDGGVGFVRGWTTYRDRVYSNLWVVRLAADGRCAEFTEWWHEWRAADPA